MFIAPFVASPLPVVKHMLTVADLKPGEIVYDLGCGDGRIVITAAKVFGARGVGVDIDPVRIHESTENAIKAGVMDRVKEALFNILAGGAAPPRFPTRWVRERRWSERFGGYSFGRNSRMPQQEQTQYIT
jgi:SAM-dependent methyltransferase